MISFGISQADHFKFPLASLISDQITDQLLILINQVLISLASLLILNQ